MELPGCRFYPRCAHGVAACEHGVPAMHEFADGGISQCIRTEELSLPGLPA